MTRERIELRPKASALFIHSMQNDVVSEGGALEFTGSPAHARSQNIIANVARLAAIARSVTMPVFHLHFVAEASGIGLQTNMPVMEMVQGKSACIRGSWGAAPVAGVEPHDGDYVIEKVRVNAFYGTRLNYLLRALDIDTLVITGVWTHSSIEHAARHGADEGYRIFVPSDCVSSMNEEWHHASIDYAMREVATVVTCADVESALQSPVASS